MPRWALLVIACAVAIAWSPAVRGPYQYDDAITPLSDPASKSLGAFAHELPRTLRPLTKWTYAVEGSLGLDEHPGVRRGVSISIAIIAAWLFAGLLRTLGVGEPWAVVGALVFAIHPVAAESTIAISGRSQLLANALTLGALLALARDHTRWAAACYLGACLSRETALAAVLPLLILEVTAWKHSWRAHAQRMAPIAAACVVAAVWIVLTPRYRALAGYSFGLPHTALWQQLSAIPVGVSLFVRLDRLSIDHGDPLALQAGDWRVVISILLLAAAATIVVIAASRRRVSIAVGAALWIAAIVPTQTFVGKLDPLTERPLALALAGIVIAIVPRRAGWLAGAAIVALLGIATFLRARLYESPLALWQDAAIKSQINARPIYNYAVLLDESGLHERAREEFERAHALAPEDPDIERAWRRSQPKESR